MHTQSKSSGYKGYDGSTRHVRPHEAEEGTSRYYYRRALLEDDGINRMKDKKQSSSRHFSSGIQNHVECYDQYFNHHRAAESREVSEEYDIESDISGLTRDSDFTVKQDDKENRRSSKKRQTKSNSHKNKRDRKKESESSMNKSSYLWF